MRSTSALAARWGLSLAAGVVTAAGEQMSTRRTPATPAAVRNTRAGSTTEV